MIVRSVLTTESLDAFDYFNDHKDTKAWLCGLLNHPTTHDKAKVEKVIQLLDKGYAKWFAEYQKRHNPASE